MRIGHRRLRNIIQRMLDGDDFFTNETPRIARWEIEEVEKALGVSLQIEHTHGAQAGPIAVYPLHKDKFTEKANKFLNRGLATSPSSGETPT